MKITDGVIDWMDAAKELHSAIGADSAGHATEQAPPSHRCQHYQTIWNHMYDAVLICNAERHIVDMNPAFTALTGYSLQDFSEKPVEIWQSGLMDQAFYEQIHTSLQQFHYWQGELWLSKKFSTPFPAYLTIYQHRQDHHFIAIIRDLSAQKEVESRIHSRVYFDLLTDLPNRLSFAQNLTRLTASHEPFALIVIDLKGMRIINNSMDHQTGDDAIRAVANRLSGRLRAGDFIARIGGDEFALLLKGIASQAQAEKYARQVIGCFDWPFQLSQQQLYMSASVGVALWPLDAEHPDELLTNAEHAVFAAKQQHDVLRFYSSDLRNEQLSKNRLQQDLANAIKYHQLFLEYQPIWDIQQQQVVKLEALVRWRHPTRGMISPVEFIPLAEECGLIQSLGQWILLHACADLVKLHRAGFASLKMSVNRSTPEFQTIDLDAKEWLGTIEDMGLSPSSIIFEITESLLMANQDSNRQRMEALRQAGCRIAIDDFGTGYSALSYLRNFPIDIVKIDRTFVKQIPQARQEALLLDGIINLMRSLEMELIVEGVESEEQLEFLQARSCSLIQGFYFSKPLPFDRLVQYLTAQRQT